MVNQLYGFRPKERPQYKNTDSLINPIDPRVPTPPGVQPLPTSTTTDQPYHSGPSAENDGGNEGPDAASVRGAAGQAQGLEYGQATPGQLAGAIGGALIPGFGLFSGAVTKGLDDATGFGGVPEHQRFGAAGTLDPTSGGVFDTQGRAYDPVTGLALNSYASKDAYKNSDYVQGIFSNPFSLDSYLSDPANAPAFTAANNARAAGSNAALGFNAAILGDRGLYADDELGNVPTDEERARLAQHIGQTEYGFEEHTVAPDTATNQAIQGVGYTGSGAAPAGSQFSSTGTFSSSHSDDNNDSNIDSPTSSAHSGGSSGVSFADDAADSGSGGGGDK